MDTNDSEADNMSVSLSSCKDEDEDEESPDNVDGDDGDDHVTPIIKHRRTKTVALYITFICLGITGTVHLAALVHLEKILRTDMTSLSGALTGGAVGYLVGSAVGGVLYDNINRELVFASSGMMAGVLLILMARASSIAMFGVIYSIKGITQGITDTGGQAYILSLWTATKYQQPSMQALHCLLSVGYLLGPLVITPFLSPLPSDNCIESNITMQNQNYRSFHRGMVAIQNSDNVQRSDYNQTIKFPDLYNNLTANNQTLINPATAYKTMSSTGIAMSTVSPCGSNQTVYGDMELVRYGYVTGGVIVGLGSVLFFILFFCEGCGIRRHADNQPTTDPESQTKSSRIISLYILIGTSLFLIFYAYMEDVTGTYLAMVVVKEHDWTPRHSALLSSLQAGMLGLGGLLSIPISTLLAPSHMLIGCTTICTACLAMLATVAYLHDFIIWLTAAIFGLFIAPVFPSTMLWVSTKMQVTGKAAGVMAVANCVGYLSGIFLASRLSQTFSVAWIMYLAVIGSLTSVVILVTLIVSSSCISRRTLTQREVPGVTDEFIPDKTV